MAHTLTCTAASGRSCTVVLEPGVAPVDIVGEERRCIAGRERFHIGSEGLAGTLGWGRHRWNKLQGVFESV